MPSPSLSYLVIISRLCSWTLAGEKSITVCFDSAVAVWFACLTRLDSIWRGPIYHKGSREGKGIDVVHIEYVVLLNLAESMNTHFEELLVFCN